MVMNPYAPRTAPVAAGVATNKRCPQCNLIKSLHEIICKRCETPLSQAMSRDAQSGAQEAMPLWVRIANWGVRERKGLLGMMWISISLGVGLAAVGYLPGLLFFL